MAAIAAIAFSCSPESSKDPDDNGGENETPTVETYSTISAALTGTTLKSVWEEGDEIYIVGVSQDNEDKESVYALTSGAGTATGTFAPKDGWKALEKGGKGYFAAYPYDENLVFAQHNTFSTTLNAVQESIAPMFTYSEDASSINFSSFLGALKFSFTGKGNVASISIDDDNTKSVLSGNTTVNPKTKRVTIKNGSSGKNSVTLKLADKVALDETNPVSFTIEVPEGTLSTGATFTVLDINDSPIAVIPVPAQTITAGAVTDAGSFYVTPVAQTVDISSSGTANCYLVSDCGKYKFPAVKGNDSSTKLTDATTAELLWETYGTDAEVIANSLVKSVSYADGYVNFETADTYTEGNALVCVKDASGNILWAWHLWFTSVTSLPTVPAINEIELMDRNLGALGNSQSDGALAYGLIYQWGRPAPFVTCDGTAQGVSAKTYPAESEVFKTEKLAEETTVEYGIAHPTTRLTGKYCWYTPNDANLWDTGKTIYDPCPAGWQVPSNGIWSGWADSAEVVKDKGATFNGGWYPYAGFWKYSGSSFSTDGTYGMMWTCIPQYNASQGGYINAQSLQISSNKESYDRKSSLFSVRCRKI